MSLKKRYNTISVQENIQLRRDLDDRDASLLGQINDAMATAPPTQAVDVVFVPVGSITSIEVQSAIEELDTTIEASYGGALSGKFKFKNTTSAVDPSSGNLNFDNASYSLVTNIYISQTTDEATDAENILASIKVDDVVYVQQRDDATRWIRGKVTAIPADNGAWWTVPIAVESFGSGSMIANNAKIIVIVNFNTSSAVVELDKTLAYDINGKLETITTSEGTKTFAYNGSGKLVTITGTGIYPTKTLSYDINGKLETITIS